MTWKSPKMRLLIRLSAMSALWKQCQQSSSTISLRQTSACMARGSEKRSAQTAVVRPSSRNIDPNKRRRAQEPMPSWSLFVPAQGWSLFCKCLKRNGGDDETRTRDLCRDRVATTSTYNNLQGYRGLPSTSKYAVGGKISGWRSGWRVQRNATA